MSDTGTVSSGDGLECTEDGRWIVIDGRRWRASDPAIPERFRRELVDELMAACRAVSAACRSDDTEAEVAARHRVRSAKVALGERGQPWWEPPSLAGRRERLTGAVVTLAGHRAPDRTICPSDAARSVGGDDWRALMELTGDVVRSLACGGEVDITQKGEVLDPDGEWRGPIRVRTAPRPDGGSEADGR